MMSQQRERRAAERSILVVDDEPGMLALFEFMFARSGLRVLTAANAEEALALAGANDVQAAFVDLHLQRRNSLELVRGLQQLCPNMTLIPMLCYPDAALLAQLDVPPAQQLYKPFDVAQVRHLVAESCHLAA